MRYLTIIGILAAAPALAQEQPNPQVVIQQLAMRQQDEMSRAITCEASKVDLQTKLAAALKELEALKKEKK